MLEADPGGEAVFMVIVNDLSSVEQLRKRFLSTSINPVILIDVKGIIQAINPVCCKTFQYQENELVGQDLSTIMLQTHANSPDSFIQCIEQKVLCLRRDGTIFSLFLTLTEAKIGDDVYYTGVMRRLSMEKKSSLNSKGTIKREGPSSTFMPEDHTASNGSSLQG
jgi:PAS domain S-box-containing protein